MTSHFETIKSLLIMTLFLGAPLLSQATEPKCIAVADVQALQKDVNFLESYDVADLCRPETRTYQLAETLLYMKNYRWDVEKNKSNPFNQDIIPHSFWEFFISGLKKTVTDSEDTPTNAGVAAATLPALRDGNIYLFKAFYDANTVASRVSMLLHEAQHFNESPHSLCERAGAISQRNCDQSIKEKRSWAVTVEALTKMLLPANDSVKLSDEEQLRTKQEVLQMSAFVFNEPLNLQAVYLIDENNNAFIYDGETLEPARTVMNAKIFSRYLTLLSFPLDKTANGTLNVFSAQLDLLPPSGGTAISYSNQRKQDRKDVIDIFNNETCTAAVFDDSASFSDWPLISFKNFNPVRVFCASEGENLTPDAYYVTDSQGHSHEYTLVNNKIQTRELEIDPFQSWQGFAQLRSLRLGIGTNGFIYEQTSPRNWKIHPRFAGKRFKLMTRPFLWTPAFYK